MKRFNDKQTQQTTDSWRRVLERLDWGLRGPREHFVPKEDRGKIAAKWDAVQQE